MIVLPSDSQCRTCKHFLGVLQPDGTESTERFACKAFGSIPTEILTNKVSHDKPVKGDGGVIREPDPESMTKSWDESKHPRHSSGSDKGGQFASKNDSSRGQSLSDEERELVSEVLMKEAPAIHDKLMDYIDGSKDFPDILDDENFKKWAGTDNVVMNSGVGGTEEWIGRIVGGIRMDVVQQEKWLKLSKSREEHISQAEGMHRKWQEIIGHEGPATPEDIEKHMDAALNMGVIPSPSTMGETRERAGSEWDREAAKLEKSKEKLRVLEKIRTDNSFETGKPVVAFTYHGTPTGGFETFSDDKLGENTGAGSALLAHFSAGSEKTAESYAGYGGAGSVGYERFKHKDELIDEARQYNFDGDYDVDRDEIEDHIVSNPDMYKDLAEAISDSHGDSDFEWNNKALKPQIYKLLVKFENPLVVNQEGNSYRETTYRELLEDANTKGHDGLIVLNSYDPGKHAVGMNTTYRDNIFATFDERNIKSATDNDGSFDPESSNIKKSWDESKHPRHSAGSDKGGQFTEKDGGVAISDLNLHEDSTLKKLGETLDGWEGNQKSYEEAEEKHRDRLEKVRKGFLRGAKLRATNNDKRERSLLTETADAKDAALELFYEHGQLMKSRTRVMMTGQGAQGIELLPDVKEALISHMTKELDAKGVEMDAAFAKHEQLNKKLMKEMNRREDHEAFHSAVKQSMKDRATISSRSADENAMTQPGFYSVENSIELDGERKKETKIAEKWLRGKIHKNAVESRLRDSKKWMRDAEAQKKVNPLAADDYDKAVKAYEKDISIRQPQEVELNPIIRQKPPTVRQRAHASRGIEIALSSNSRAATVVHEYGHIVESVIPKTAQGFLRKRIKGTTAVNLRERFGGGYDPDEYGSEDDFAKTFKIPSRAHYVGKVYQHGSTEITAMGLEQLYRDPKELAEKDPEYFRFMVGVLDGTWAEEELDYDR